MTQKVSIGKIVAVHGLKGELILKHALGKKTALVGVKTLFIQETKDNYLPWFIRKAKAKTLVESYVQLEGIDNPENAKKILQKLVWLSKADFDAQVNKASPITLIGYTVINDDKPVGIIIEIIEQPHQILCNVQVGDKEAYVPLHGESLISIDHKKKWVNVTLPEGLLEIYLG